MVGGGDFLRRAAFLGGHAAADLPPPLVAHLASVSEAPPGNSVPVKPCHAGASRVAVYCVRTLSGDPIVRFPREKNKRRTVTLFFLFRSYCRLRGQSRRCRFLCVLAACRFYFSHGCVLHFPGYVEVNGGQSQVVREVIFQARSK